MKPLALAVLAGCLGDPHAACTLDADCRTAFGFGQVCGDGGYCEAGELPDRCTSSFPDDLLTDPGAYTDAVVMASVYDAQYDVAEAQSARLAFIEAAAKEGISGTPVAVLECSYEEGAFDDLLYPESIAAIADFLTGRLGIVAYVGPYTSGQTEALYNATLASEAWIISGAATSPSLTYLDGIEHSDADPGLIWRTAPPDSLQGKVAAEDMLARAVDSVAVVYQTGAYGEGLFGIFNEEFTAAGGDVLALQFGTSAELSAHVATLAAQSVDEVFVISSEAGDVAGFLNAAGGIGGYETKGIFLADAAKDTDMLDALNSDGRALVTQVRGTAPAAPANTIYNTFQAAYSLEYAQDPQATIYMPYAYDSAWLAIYAATWSLSQEGGLSGKGMGAGMRHVSNGDAIDLLPADWNTGRANFEAGQAVDVAGSSGELDYDPDTEETATPVDVWVVNATLDGFETVDTIEPE
jgi:branched-chain amino acid transport system substrate-binding protein